MAKRMIFPAGSTVYKSKVVKGMNAFIVERDGRENNPWMIGGYSSSRAKKPMCRSYANKKSAESALRTWWNATEQIEMEKIARRKERQAQKRAENANVPVVYTEGTIVYHSWGYEQTNVDFYKITNRSGDTCTLSPIGYATKNEDNGWMSGTCTPDPDNVTGNPIRKRVIKSRGQEIGFSFSYGWAKEWSGQPVSWSGYH